MPNFNTSTLVRTLAILVGFSFVGFMDYVYANQDDVRPAAKTSDTENTRKSPAPEPDVTNPERGWWWYEIYPEDEDLEISAPATPPAQPELSQPLTPKEDPCKSKSTWSVDCGFVNPGRDFEFQAKQRDELLKAMVMSPNDPKTVEAFQYYMKWIMDQAATAANMWYFNRIQNPDLDPQTTSPVSSFGIKLVTKIKKARSREIFDLLKEDGMLVYFTRTDCSYCHDMLDTILRVARDTGIELWNASLDDECMPGIDKCLRSDKTTLPAAALSVRTVPTLFLHVKPGIWLRISTGVTDAETIKSRIVNFFSAYRAALVKGVSNGQGMRPSVDFSQTSVIDGKGIAEGVNAAPPADISGEEVTDFLMSGRYTQKPSTP